MPTPTRPTLTKLAEYDIRHGGSDRFELDMAGTCTCTRRYIIFWAERFLAAKYFLGYSQINTDSADPATYYLQRLTPMKHPDDSTFRATKIAVLNHHQPLGPRGADPDTPGDRSTNPLADGSVGAKYLKTVIEVTYSRPLYRILEDSEIGGESGLTEADRFVELKAFDPATDVHPMPGHVAKYVGPSGTPAPPDGPMGIPIPYGIPLIQPGSTIRALWRDLPAGMLRFDLPANQTNWQKRLFGDPLGSPRRYPYLGSINKAGMWGLPRWSLLLTEVRPIQRPAVCPLADFLPISWDMELVWKYEPQTQIYKYYNHLKEAPAVNASGYYQVSRRNVYVNPASGTLGDSDSVFAERNHLKLFQVGLDLT